MIARRHASLAIAALLPALGASAAPFPTRSGTSGILDVPDSEVLLLKGTQLGGALRLEKASGEPAIFGPSPLSLGIGLARRLELGLSLREGGRPKDERPSPLLLGSELKFHAIDAKRLRPGLAVGLAGERLNSRGSVGPRVAASTEQVGRWRFAAVAGVDALFSRPFPLAPVGGLALTFDQKKIELAAELLTARRGFMLGGAARWVLSDSAGVFLGVDYLLSDRSLILSAGFAFASAGKPPPPPPPESPEQARARKARTKEATAEARATEFTDETPRFRMRIPPVVVPVESAGRHLQHGLGPPEPRKETATPPPTPSPAPAAPPQPPLKAPAATPRPPSPPQKPQPEAEPADVPPDLPDALPLAPLPKAAPSEAPPLPPVEKLKSGTAGQIQLRDAILKKEPEIRRCVESQLKLAPDAKARGVVKLVVGPEGQIQSLEAIEGNLGGTRLEKCLKETSRGWRLPASGTTYDVEVPISVIGKGAAW